jgi:hypothetical protein
LKFIDRLKENSMNFNALNENINKSSIGINYFLSYEGKVFVIDSGNIEWIGKYWKIELIHRK